jgi:hypothetical protein
VNPSERVTSSDQLWGDQVAMTNAGDEMDSATFNHRYWNDYFPGGSPVIYYFGAGSRRFVAKTPLYPM